MRALTRGLTIVCAVTTMGAVTPLTSAHAAVKKVVSARTTAQIAMPSTGYSNIQAIKLTSGAWTVIAKAVAMNAQTSDFVRCQLYDSTHHAVLDGATTHVGSTSSHGAPITNLVTVTVAPAAKITVVQQCGHDAEAGNSSYIDTDASLVGFAAMGGLDANQMSTRTAAQFPVPVNGASATVLSMTVGTGAWAIGFRVTGVSFVGGGNGISCLIKTPTGATPDTWMAVGGSGESYAATNAAFGFLAAGGTIQLNCNMQGASGGYLDPGAVLWARKVKALTAVDGGCGAHLVNGTTDLVALTRRQICAVAGDTVLSSASVSKGTWVAIASESNIVTVPPTEDPTFHRCDIDTQVAEGALTHLDTTSVWRRHAYDVGETMVGTFKATTPVTFVETCHSFGFGDEILSLGSLLLIKP